MDPPYYAYQDDYFDPQSHSKECPYTLGNLEFSGIFSEWESVLAAILISAVLTLPAISVYFRKTDEKPMRSYFYSCLVKGVVSFLTNGLLLGDIAKFLKLKAEKGCEYEGMTIHFRGAVLTEVVEIIFDFGRLVLCFQDPGKIDFYQNVRWNSRMLYSSTSRSVSRDCGMAIGMLRFTSSLPFYLLLSILWIVVFIGNIDLDLFADLLESSSERTYILQGIAIFVSLSFSCTGAYYLIRMCSPYSSPNGEESGVGFFWSRFKLITVDLPSMISTIYIRPSSLFIFWSAEFINDIFPFVGGTFAEEGLGCLNPNHDGEDTREQNSTKEASSRAFEHSIRQQKEGTVTISRGLLPSSTRDGEKNIPENNFNASSYRIDRTLPPILEEQITEADWQEFCNRTDKILEPSALMMSRTSSMIFASFTIFFVVILTVAASTRKTNIVVIVVCIMLLFVTVAVPVIVLYGCIPCSLMLIKSTFIFLALSASVMYWSVWYSSLPMEYIHGHALFPILLVLSCTLASWACIKSCFRRKLDDERVMVEELEQLCKDDNNIIGARRNAQLKFSLRTEDDIWKNMKIWCCRPGFSSGNSLQSVKGFDFILLNLDHLDIEEGSLSNEEEPEVHSIDSSEYENDGEASVPNTFVGTLDPDERQNTDAKISQEFEVLQGSPELDFEVSNQCSEHICGYFGSR